MLARRFGTGSNKVQIQQQFRTRNQSNDEDYMRDLDALEGLRSQGFTIEEVTVRRYEIMQRFIEEIRSFSLKQNLALMYAQEQYVDAPPIVEALWFTVRQYLRMRDPTRAENFPAPQQQQQPCGTKIAGEWVCPSNPRGMNDFVHAVLTEQGTTAFRIFGRMGHLASEYMVPENAATEEQLKAAWYATLTNSADFADADDQIGVISTLEEGGPSRPVVVTCGEKQLLTTLEAPAPDCTENLISIHLL